LKAKEIQSRTQPLGSFEIVFKGKIATNYYFREAFENENPHCGVSGINLGGGCFIN
jgi:hypothetical protein